MITKTISFARQQIATRKSVRYLIAGGLSEAIEYFSFLILLWMTDLLYISNSVSFCLGVISGFIFHKVWTFRGEHQFKTHQQFMGYVGLAAINFVLINILVGLFVTGLGMPAFIAKFLAIAICAIWSFFLANKVFFRRRAERPPE